MPLCGRRCAAPPTPSAARRTLAFEAIPDLEALRERASAIRLEVLDHLPAYLEQFTASATAAGATVHRSADGAEARRLIADLLKERGVGMVAKSKSMVSEEIQLNAHLEQEGIEVVETDLGEYIIQLERETPSHIIVPAIHKNRRQIGRLFAERLGVPYSEDPQVLTQTARRVLREKFFAAGAGISGANFAIAESGSLVLFTNEGNGRMVTTVPPLHIAVLSIEKLLPSLRELPTFIRLLPRSATGQAITSYLSIITGTRKPGEATGARELHIVLVDNGRSRDPGGGVPGDAQVHPLRGVHQRLSRLPHRRRPRLRLDLSGTDGADPHRPAHRDGEGPPPGRCQHPLRRLRRRLPGEDPPGSAHPQAPRAPGAGGVHGRPDQGRDAALRHGRRFAGPLRLGGAPRPSLLAPGAQGRRRKGGRPPAAAGRQAAAPEAAVTPEETIDRFLENAGRCAAGTRRVGDGEELRRALADLVPAGAAVYCPALSDLEKAAAGAFPGRVDDYAAAEVSIEEVFAGIAETGSIVCASVEGRAVQSSLLPARQVAILPAGKDFLFPG